MTDCFFIGHNQIDFSSYEKKLRTIGKHSPTYRDLNLNFLYKNDVPYSAADFYNLHFGTYEDSPLDIGETFSTAIAYLGNYLHKRNLSFDFINSFQNEKEKLKQTLTEGSIMSVAIITTLYVSEEPITEIVEYIRKYNDKVKIIIGGPYIFNQFSHRNDVQKRSLLKLLDADYVIENSKGEQTLVELLVQLKNNKVIDTKNIYVKGGYGKFDFYGKKDEKIDLDKENIDWNIFLDRIKGYIGVRTTISCPFECSFCSFPEHAGEYQTMNVSSIEKELDIIANSQQIKHIHFIDDTFNIPPNRFKDILKTIIKKNYGFTWHSHFRCQFADEETVRLMEKSGCTGVFLGLESGSQEILDRMNKKTTIEKYQMGLDLLRNSSILTMGCFIIGFPGESEETIEKTFSFIKNSGLDFYRAQLWYCDVTTPVYKNRLTRNEGLEGAGFNWKHRTMDSDTACGFIEQKILEFEDPIWMPEYNFEFDAVFHLLHRGVSIEDVKFYLKCFREGLIQKIMYPENANISSNTLDRMLSKIQRKNCIGKKGHSGLNVEFDF